MQRVGLFEAKNRLSEICERVATRRRPVLVLRRGQPLVRIVPLEDDGQRDDVWSARKRFLAAGGPLSEAVELPRRGRERRAVPLVDDDGAS